MCLLTEESGSSSGESSDTLELNTGQSENDYEKLLRENKESAHHEKITERSKRDIDENGNPDFEGLPESLAVIQRENPRTKILNRELKGQSLPDIPLPFNHVKEEEVLNPDESVATTSKMKRKRASEDEPRAIIKPISDSTLSSLNLLKRSVGEEKIKNLKIIDEAKAKSLFDDEEGSFFNHIKRDGIYYDSRSNRFLISAKAEAMKKYIIPTEKSEKKRLKGNIQVSKRRVKSVRKLKQHVKGSGEQSKHQKVRNNDTRGTKNETVKSTPITFNISAGSKQKFVRKRSIESDEIHQSHEAKAQNDFLSIQRRNVLSDDDPNIDYVMRYDGKTDEIDDEQKAMLQQETQRLNIKKAEEVYKFARSVMDLVVGSRKKKEKRHSESNSWTGVWSGLGTSPEFVPGLIKRDYINPSSKAIQKMNSGEMNKYVNKERKQRRSSVAANKTYIETAGRKSGIWTGDHGFPLFIQNKSDADSEKKILKRNTLEDMQNGRDTETLHRGPYSHLSLITNRNQIPTEDDYEVLLEKSSAEQNNVETKSTIKKRRDINEQTETEHMELGSLGSLNLGKRNSVNDALVNIKTQRVTQKNGESKTIIKREDKELDSLENSHLTTKPFQDGNVVLAFDEVKELLPSRRYFNKDEEDLLEPINDVQSKMVIAKTDGEKFDVDKDLAESMVLSGDNKRSHVYGLKATNIVYENNENPVNERSKLDQKPLLTANDKKLQKAQLSNAQSDEVHEKEEQMRNWVNNYKDESEKETDKRIQEVSDELAESNIELEKLKSINKAEEESAYLAKRLEEKTSTNNTSSVSREEKFKELQQKIFEEQALYRKLLNDQHRQYQEKIKTEQEELANQRNNSANRVLLGNNDETTLNEASVPKFNNTQNELTNQTERSPFQAQIQSPVPEQIHFEKLNNNYVQPIPNTQTLSPQVQEHVNRVHPSMSNETFTDEAVDGWMVNSSLNTSPMPSTNALPVTIKNATSTMPAVVTPPPPTPSITIATTTKEVKQLNTVTTTPTEAAKTTANPNISTPVMNKTSTSPTFPITLKTTSITITTTTTTTTTTKPLPITTVSPPISTRKMISQTPPNTTVAPVILPQANASKEKINASNTSFETSKNDTESINITAEPELSNQTEPVHAEEYYQTIGDNKQESNEHVTNKTVQKLQFPLEISYRPRILPNITKKKLEIEPRADGYIGCFFDHLVQGRDLPVRAGIPLVTPKTCRVACKKSGYKYAGLQYGYLCFCGNTYGKYDIVPDDECNTVCSGNDTFTCGGLWRNEIFDTAHVNDTTIGSVQYFMPPKVRQSMDEVPGTVKANIPTAPNLAMKEKEELVNNVQYSEYEDMKALENIKSDAVRRSNIGIVRNVGNYTDEDLIQAAALELKLNQANQKDVENLNHHIKSIGPQTATPESSSDEYNEPSPQAFTYLHPQKVEPEEAQHSPVLPLNIEPGTHLFRGEIMLQQPWYDDLTKPESTKYKILTGNIEVAIKNVFANDTSFLKAEVLSLREDIGRTPHKTVVDFTMTFTKNEPTDTVTHKLFDSILTTKRLDEMPVNPVSLKIKEYLHDAGAQAYIPKLVNGQFHLDTKQPIDLKYNEKNQLVFPTNTTNVIPEQKPSLSVNAAYQEMISPMSTTESVKTRQYSSVPLNPAVQTHVVPMVTDGMTELRNYMRDQTYQENSRPKNTMALPPIRMKENKFVAPPKEKKVPYVLRMFFWKDMLARKKREQIENEEGEKNSVHAKKVIHFTNGLPVIRARRSQADEWPTAYKKDDEKRGYSNSLRRRKREDIYNEAEDERDEEFDTLFGKKDFKNSTKREVGEELSETTKTLVSESLIKGHISDDQVLRRTKRDNVIEGT